MTAADKQLINLTNETTSLTSPKGMVDFAGTLKAVIVEQGLYTNIKGKNYVHVEAWQFAGAAMGVIAIVKSTERIQTNTPEINYRAEVELRRLENDQLVGSGIAFCSNKEYSKKQFDEYAIASMAQTRATSKAYRIAFGWLMKMAGYEATPHEEMDGIDAKPEPEPTSRNVVAENAKYMNTKAADVAEYLQEDPKGTGQTRRVLGTPPAAKKPTADELKAPSEEQFAEISRLAKKKGLSDGDIANRLMLIDTSKMANDTIAKLKKEVGE